MKKGFAISLISLLAVAAIALGILYYTNNEEKNRQIALLNSDVANKTKQVDILQTDLADKATQIEALSTDIAGKTKQIEALNADVMDKVEQIETLQADVAGKAEQIEILHAEITEKEVQIGELNAELFSERQAKSRFSNFASSIDGTLIETISNTLEQDQLMFVQSGKNWVLDLPEEKWGLITRVEKNVLYDNGMGYIDLGLDDMFTFDKEGCMVADIDGTWLALNGQPVAYYHESSLYLDNGCWIVTGRVPAILNGSRVDLLIVFNNEHEYGYVAGACKTYTDDNGALNESVIEIKDGDVIIALVDLYNYEHNYSNSMTIGNPITVSGSLVVSYVYLPDKEMISVAYQITDIYNKIYWSSVIGE